MNMQEIRAIARACGIATGKLRKAELIRTIQRHEGNIDCFRQSGRQECEQLGCLWRTDCLEDAR